MERYFIPVVYRCWGCKSELAEWEKTDLPIPCKEVWNLCPDCRLLNDATKMGYSRRDKGHL